MNRIIRAVSNATSALNAALESARQHGANIGWEIRKDGSAVVTLDFTARNGAGARMAKKRAKV